MEVLFASSRMGSAYDLLQKRKILSQARNQAMLQLCLLSLTFHAQFSPCKVERHFQERQHVVCLGRFLRT